MVIFHSYVNVYQRVITIHSGNSVLDQPVFRGMTFQLLNTASKMVSRMKSVFFFKDEKGKSPRAMDE